MKYWTKPSNYCALNISVLISMCTRWAQKAGKLWSSPFPLWTHLIGPEWFPQVCLSPLMMSPHADTNTHNTTWEWGFLSIVRSVLSFATSLWSPTHLFSAPISPCSSSSQRSTARCSIMERIRNLAQRKLLRSWCWPRKCWRRSETGNHSSHSGSLWMRRQMRPRNVCVFHSWPKQHMSSFSVGPGKKNTGQHLVKQLILNIQSYVEFMHCVRDSFREIWPFNEEF